MHAEDARASPSRRQMERPKHERRDVNYLTRLNCIRPSMFVWETEESSGKETVVNFGRRGWAGPDLLNSSEPFLKLEFE